jgi:hypothetical protein
MPREHGDDGTYVETVPLGRVLEVFDAVDGPVILSADVADELECSRETARRKLQQLHDRGDLARRKVSRRVIYWRAEGSDTFDAEGLRGDPETTLADESDDTDARAAAGRDATETPPDTGNGAHDADGAGEEDPLATAGDRIDTLDLAGTGTDYERRRDAVLKMYEHLRERSGERVSKSDFADLLDGTDVGYGGGFASLWANWVKSSGDRPNALDTLPGVELQGNDYVFRPEGER